MTDEAAQDALEGVACIYFRSPARLRVTESTLMSDASTVESAHAPVEIAYTPQENCKRPEMVIAAANRNSNTGCAPRERRPATRSGLPSLSRGGHQCTPQPARWRFTPLLHGLGSSSAHHSISQCARLRLRLGILRSASVSMMVGGCFVLICASALRNVRF